MKENFMICIESLHVGDAGTLQNVSLAGSISWLNSYLAWLAFDSTYFELL